MTIKTLILILILSLFISCEEKEKSIEHTQTYTVMEKENNLLESMSSEDLKGFKWMNSPQSFEFKDGRLLINPGDKTDFFNDPGSNAIVGNAPMLYKEIEGDFLVTAKAKPDFKDIWNACAMMVYADSLHWGKFCFEKSDATGVSIVSVVTKDRSDDSNGPIVNEAAEIWMRVARKGNLYGFYWSRDGTDYKMARLFSLPPSDSIKIGLVAQCPAGENVEHEFSYFTIEKRSIEDMRKGI